MQKLKYHGEVKQCGTFDQHFVSHPWEFDQHISRKVENI